MGRQEGAGKWEEVCGGGGFAKERGREEGEGGGCGGSEEGGRRRAGGEGEEAGRSLLPASSPSLLRRDEGRDDETCVPTLWAFQNSYSEPVGGATSDLLLLADHDPRGGNINNAQWVDSNSRAADRRLCIKVESFYRPARHGRRSWEDRVQDDTTSVSSPMAAPTLFVNKMKISSHTFVHKIIGRPHHRSFSCSSGSHGSVLSPPKTPENGSHNPPFQLGDFGLADRVRDDQTHVSEYHTAGTMLYMAPEALHQPHQPCGRKELRKAVDVWAMGKSQSFRSSFRPHGWCFISHINRVAGKSCERRWTCGRWVRVSPFAAPSGHTVGASSATSTVWPERAAKGYGHVWAMGKI